MKRLYIVVEGQTEERFVKDVLYPHFLAIDASVTPIVVETRRDRRTGKKIGKGGGRWRDWRRDLRRVLLEQAGAEVRVTTMFDLYGLPDDFPALAAHAHVHDTSARADALEAEMSSDIADTRFIPYLQRHEFEALVLSGLDELELLLDARPDLDGLARLRAEIAGLPPEDVNDGRDTAPSKRLESNIPGYQKTFHGPLVTESVGLAALRASCSRFGAWIARLETP